MNKYIKRPVAIEAIEWTGDNYDAIARFANNKVFINTNIDLVIETLEGDMFASIGDMIINGVKGECYPCKPDIFKLTYFTDKEYAELNA